MIDLFAVLRDEDDEVIFTDEEVDLDYIGYVLTR